MWGGEVAHPTGNSKGWLAQVLELGVWPRLSLTLQTYSGSRPGSNTVASDFTDCNCLLLLFGNI